MSTPVMFQQKINESNGLPMIFCVKCSKTETPAGKSHRRSKVRYRWSQDHAKVRHSGTAIYL